MPKTVTLPPTVIPGVRVEVRFYFVCSPTPRKKLLGARLAKTRRAQRIIVPPRVLAAATLPM
jgi:hypothetical protein